MALVPLYNQSQSIQPSNNNSQTKQGEKNVADNQATKFAERMNKEKKANEKYKNEKNGKEEKESLDSLLAKRSRASKEYLKDQMEQQEFSGQGHGLSWKELQGADKSNALAELQKSSRAQEVAEKLQQLVDKIYVSGKDAVNGAEVRLSIKDSILPGTEIRINRNEGAVSVMLNTTSAESHNLLAQHKASLEKMLADKFTNEIVKVDLHMADNNHDENDGRSRNEYVPEDEKKDE